MPLHKNGLHLALKDLFLGVPHYPRDVAAAGNAWASVYATYGKQALAVTTSPLVPAADASAGVLAGALAAAFSTAQAAGPGFLNSLVPAMVTAFSAFWPAVAFFAPGVAGIAISPPPAGLTDPSPASSSPATRPRAPGRAATARPVASPRCSIPGRRPSRSSMPPLAACHSHRCCSHEPSADRFYRLPDRAAHPDRRTHGRRSIP